MSVKPEPVSDAEPEEYGEISIGPSITVTRAKSGRGRCQSARCPYDTRTLEEKLQDSGGKKGKIKGQALIPKGDWKVQITVPVAAFEGGELTKNYHLACFFIEETHHKAATGCIRSIDRMSGTDAMTGKERKLVCDMIARCSVIWNRWKDDNGRRSFTQDELDEREGEKMEWMEMAACNEVAPIQYNFDPAQRAIEMRAKMKEAAKKKAKERKTRRDADEESEEEKTPKKRVKKEKGEVGEYETEGYELPEMAEKKKSVYKKFIDRPKIIGGAEREPPEGSANCLAGLTFVISGVFKALTVDDLKALIVRLGGRNVGTISKKVNYLLLGSEPGETKKRDARDKGIEIISEDGFYDLIESRSACGEGEKAAKEAAEAPAKPAKAKKPRKKQVKVEEGEGDDAAAEEEDEEEKPIKKKAKAVKEEPTEKGRRKMPGFL